jgi:hypothetical protein
MTVRDIINSAPLENQPPDLTAEVCGGRRGLALRPATTLKGFGVSLGRFDKRDEALKVLRIWSDSGDAHMEGASKGLLRLPKTQGYTAMVWDLDQDGARSLCYFLKVRKVSCEPMTPEILKQLAEQARAAAKTKSRPRKRSKKKKG